MSRVSLTFRIEKASPTGQFASGWFSVIEKDGKPVTDTQGDIIEMSELRKAVHRFNLESRVAKVGHSGDQKGDVVQSIIIDDDFAKAHGITHGLRGWWGTMEFHDEAVRKQVREGKLKSFSIGGRGKRTDIAKSSPTPGDVHVNAPLGARPRSRKTPIGRGRVRFKLSKINAAR